jgi:hypothetical protein
MCDPRRFTTLWVFTAFYWDSFTFIYIETDWINALPGNGSVNTVQEATIEKRGYAIRFYATDR